ncbi:MAG: hypothetical protein ACR2RL_04540 [Gammaproteobacteria bacterium]
MNGGQDLGGMHGFGPIDPEPNEPPFHTEWERRAFAITVGCGFLGEWNIDRSRHARESLRPELYLRASYYEIWLHGLQKLLDEQGLVTLDEVEARMAELAASEANA